LQASDYEFALISASSLLWTGGEIVLLPAVVKTLIVYGLDLLQVFVYVVLAFAISTISRSRAMATGISLFLLLVGGTVSELLASYFGWGKYILFGVSNFSSYILKGSVYPGTSLGFGLIVSLIYTLMFLIVSYFTLNKRDI
jgi:ABC-2 type transport system permease protein